MPDTALPPSPKRPHRRFTLWILSAVTLLLTLNWVAAIARFQVNTPIWDQWDFFNPLFENKSAWDLFTLQHGPHRQGLSFVITSWIMAASHWDTRIESLWIVSLLVVSAALALRLKYQLSGELSWRDAWIPVVVMSLAQWGSVIGVPNASHSVFPLFLLLAATNLWLHPARIVFAPALGLIAVAAIFTGFGLFAGLMLTALFAEECRHNLLSREKSKLLPPAIALFFAVLGWIFFAHGYRFDPASDGYHFPHHPLADYVKFATLMLAYPLGFDEAAPTAYIAGGLALSAGISAFVAVFFDCLFRSRTSPHKQVSLLLLGSALAFIAFTAVGRVHLGVAGGMASRYVTLLAPLWLGIGLWAHSFRAPLPRRIITLLAWTIALTPLIATRHRPPGDWPGTLGLSEPSANSLKDSAAEKIAWVSAYLQSQDAAVTDRAVGALIHPNGAALQPKLDWLKARQLSFFSSLNRPDAWHPWHKENRTTWLSPYGEENGERWMPAEARLWIHAARAGFIAFRVTQSATSLPPDARLELDHQGHRGSEAAVFLGDEIGLPVAAGEQIITLRSTGGAVPANPPHDTRSVSFRLARPRFSEFAADSEWTLNSAPTQWSPRHRWRIVSGFHGWERPADYAWTDAKLVLEVETTEPVFLNVQIETRYAAVAHGPIAIACNGHSFSLPLNDNRAAFSFPIAAANGLQQVTVSNPAGAAAPQQLGLSRDSRMLALKVSVLTLTRSSRFDPIREK